MKIAKFYISKWSNIFSQILLFTNLQAVLYPRHQAFTKNCSGWHHLLFFYQITVAPLQSSSIIKYFSTGESLTKTDFPFEGMVGYYGNYDQADIIGIIREDSKINSQSLEDTQVGYISQKYTLDNYTLKNTLWLQKAFSSKTTVAQKYQGAMEINKYRFSKIHLR